MIGRTDNELLLTKKYLKNADCNFGTGEISEIVSEYYREENRFDEIAGYIVDDDYYDDEEFFGKKVVRKSEMKQAFPSDQFRVLIALSYVRLNKLREERYLELKSYGYSFSSFVSKRSVVSKSAQIGENCIILENQTIQPKVVIEPNRYDLEWKSFRPWLSDQSARLFE